jgi:hypothetical protein
MSTERPVLHGGDAIAGYGVRIGCQHTSSSRNEEEQETLTSVYISADGAGVFLASRKVVADLDD